MIHTLAKDSEKIQNAPRNCREKTGEPLKKQKTWDNQFTKSYPMTNKFFKGLNIID